MNLETHARAIGAAALQHLRALIPSLTPRVIFRALLGILLFFCGIVFGAWLIFRYRRQLQNAS
jgi:hypothetical protein